ncbi:MAG: TraR/DksA family transcriptional regulator [Planctomycetaceae bacterium]
MSTKKSFPSDQLEPYRARLRELRDRLVGDVDTMSESVREEINPAGNLSNAPIHLGDAATGQLDANIDIMENERGILAEVQAALRRIEDKTFGRCVDCGAAIARERLELLPYASRCVRCVSRSPGSGTTSSAETSPSGLMKLTGFEAIEIAEKEGLLLNKDADAIDGPAYDLTIAEAEAIASDNPELIWLEIASEDYGVRKNMKPGR